MNSAESPNPKPKASRKIKAVAVFLMCLAVPLALVIGLEPFITLHWAMAYPKSYAKHDPHHWFARLALLSILLGLCESFWRGTRRMWQNFRAWQQTFLPLPWERQEQQADPEQPPA